MNERSNGTATLIGGSSDRSSYLALLVDKLSARVQAGEVLDADALAAEHPDYADDLRRLLPAIGLLGDLSRDRRPLQGDDGRFTESGGTLGDFRIIREVGRGGMGVVYEAEQLSLGRSVALKVLPFAATMDPKHLQRFKNEARAAASLHHEHIVPVHFVGCERGVHFIAMQFIDGVTLADVIRDIHHPEAPPKPTDATGDWKPRDSATTIAAAGLKTEHGTRRGKEFFHNAARLIIQAAEALEYAHSMGIVHRDIKPGNLMIDNAGKLWVTDFGLAKIGTDVGMTMSGDLLGTLRYMSPEQAMARHGLVDHRTDVYSLGATMYELLTGRPVVTGDDKQEILRQIAFEEPVAPRKVSSDTDIDIETILLKATGKNPADRYGTAKELGEDLQRWLENKPIVARRENGLTKARRWCRRNPAPTALVAVVLFAAVVLGATSVLFWKQKQKAEFARQQADNAYRQEVAHRKRARKTADTMYSDVAEKLLAREPGMNKVRREFLQKALEFYQEETTAYKDDPEAREQTAWAYKRIGRIHWSFGEFGKAKFAYDRATAMIGELVAENPTPELRSAQALFHFERSFQVPHDESLNEKRKALTIYEELAREFPQIAEYQQAVGNVSGGVGNATPDRREAERLLRVALAMAERLQHGSPENEEMKTDLWRALNDLGGYLSNIGQVDEADRLLDRAYTVVDDLARRSNHLEIRKGLATTCVNLGVTRRKRNLPSEKVLAHFQQALAIFRQLAADFPGQFGFDKWAANCANECGEILVTTGRIDEAISAYRESIRHKKDIAITHSNLGTALGRKGDMAGALIECQEAVRLDPNEPAGHFNLGVTFKLMRKYDEAIARLQQAAQLAPDVAMVHREIATLLSQLNKHEDAIKSHQRASRLEPNNAVAQNNFAWLLANCVESKLRNPKLAVELAQKAVELEPKTGGHWNTLGVAQFRAGDWKAAIAALTKSLELSNGGGGADNWLFLAMAHQQLGSWLPARIWYAKAVAWMDKNKPNDKELDRFRAEAEELLGIKQPAKASPAALPPKK